MEIQKEETPRKKKLRAGNERLRKKCQRLTKKIAKVKKSQSVKSAKQQAIETTSRFLSGSSLEFFKTQIMLSGKKAKGHRYSEHIKMLALSLYHTNQKCYKMLRKLFPLPCVSSLKRYMSRVDLQPGFHQQNIDGLKLKISDMAPSSKLCAIVFHEMAVKESLSYDVRQDCVEGLENFGCLGKTKYIANHASVFM